MSQNLFLWATLKKGAEDLREHRGRERGNFGAWKEISTQKHGKQCIISSKMCRKQRMRETNAPSRAKLADFDMFLGKNKSRMATFTPRCEKEDFLQKSMTPNRTSANFDTHPHKRVAPPPIREGVARTLFLPPLLSSLLFLLLPPSSSSFFLARRPPHPPPPAAPPPSSLRPPSSSSLLPGTGTRREEIWCAYACVRNDCVEHVLQLHGESRFALGCPARTLTFLHSRGVFHAFEIKKKQKQNGNNNCLDYPTRTPLSANSSRA